MSKILYSIGSLNTFLKKERPSTVCLVTSATLQKRLGSVIKEIRYPKLEVILIPDGEKAKEWKELEILLAKFSKLNLDRNAIVLALGGGSVGDLVGFASSIYLRGIRYIQIPTTLLSQVDSAHGGKTGINFRDYKNQIGNFSLPIATIVDVTFLKSLSVNQVADGLSEIIKAGLIKDPRILSILQKENIRSVTKSSRLIELVKRSIKIKLSYTDKDYKDSADRQILNAGHTIGHAIELRYKISHGRAVIIGLIQELQFTESLGLTKPSVLKNLLVLLKKLDISVNSKMKADWSTVAHDKKITGDSIIFPLIEKEGKSRLIELDKKTMKRFIEKGNLY